MDDIHKNIDAKIKTILSVQRNIRSENNSLKKDNERLIERVGEKEQEIKILKHKFSLLKVAKNLEASEQEKGDALKQINNVVREVNKCIALLNS